MKATFPLGEAARTGRSALGPADISDAELVRLVARGLGVDAATLSLVESGAQVVPYELDAITTAGRYWVSGTVAGPEGTTEFRFFVKHVQSWSRSALFADVPPAWRARAEASVPWRTEPLVYRSDLGERLPAGLAMATAVAVCDLDDKSAAVWLEEVRAVPHAWSVDDLAHAAHLLGRLAASPLVRPLASVGEQEQHWSAREYAEGRLSGQVLPTLADADVWRQPMVAAAFDARLRARLLDAADRVFDLVAELEEVPVGTAHGDACPNNLLVTADSPDIVLIDFGFWSTQPLGFDLGQLLVGDVQVGRRPAHTLPEVEAACLPAYVRGLADEGCDLGVDVLRRAHALQLLLYSGLSALPIEHLGRPPTPALQQVARERAATAAFILDLVDRTAPGVVTTGRKPT